MNLSTPLLENPLSDWLLALTVALRINVAVGMFKRLLLARLSTLAQRTSNQFDDALAGR